MRQFVKDFNNKTYKLNFNTSNSKSENKSSHHLLLRELISNILLPEKIVEELYLPGVNLYADFYLGIRDAVLEVNGSQHYKWNAFFHKSIGDFKKQQYRDNIKQQFCEHNGILFIEFKYNESSIEWENKLRKIM